MKAWATSRAGVIPGYAMRPAGGFTDTTILYKVL
jgi:hypothetical protein